MEDIMVTIEQLRRVFSEEVQQRFRFLCDDYGFLTEGGKDFPVVKYRSQQIEVAIYCDPRCSELDLSFQFLKDETKQIYGLNVALPAMLGEGISFDPGLPPSDIEEMKHGVSMMANLVKSHCGPLLLGNPEAFQRLNETLDWMGKRGMKQYREKARIRAAKAYREGDYVVAVSLFESIGPYLNKEEVEQLEDARRKNCSGFISKLKKLLH